MEDPVSEMRRPDPIVLGVLACDFRLRPPGAPSFEQLAPSLRALERDGGQLIARYDLASAEELRALVQAERACCAGIGWEIEGSATLRVKATPEQLDLLERLLRAPKAKELDAR